MKNILHQLRNRYYAWLAVHHLKKACAAVEEAMQHMQEMEAQGETFSTEDKRELRAFIATVEGNIQAMRARRSACGSTSSVAGNSYDGHGWPS